MYKVVSEFVDLQDEAKGKYHEYNVGDVYPRSGFTPSPERIAELSSEDNRLRMVLIELVEEEVKEDAGKTEKASKYSGKSGSK